MRALQAFLVALSCAVLASCGGGGIADEGIAARLEKAPRALADDAQCAASAPGYAVVEGQCHKLFDDMAAATAPAGSDAAPKAGNSGALRAGTVTPTALFNWAQAAYPWFFGGAYVEDSAYLQGYGTFLFRYYYATGNYLGVLNGYVYVYGPLTGWYVTPVGATNDYYCSIYSCAPSRAFIRWNNSGNGEIIKDANNENFAFYSDTRCLYSYARQVETTNFCLSSGRSDGYFAGVYVQVMLASSTTGGCIAVLADQYGRQVDIYTSSSGIQTVAPQNSYWQTWGCTY